MAPTSTWTLDDAVLTMDRRVTGPTHLTISMANGSTLRNGNTTPGIATPSLVLAGADPAVAPETNGTVEWTRGVSPTAVRRVAFTTVVSSVGSHFATDAADVRIHGFFSRFGSPQSDLHVEGNAALDPASSITIGEFCGNRPPMGAGESYLAVLRVAGSRDLGSAALTISPGGCFTPMNGVIATSAPNALSGSFTRPVPGGRLPVPDNAIIPAGSGFVRIDYDDAAGTVTATQAAGPTISVATSHTPTVPGRPVTYTATVSPAPTAGTVSFVHNGTVIDGCAARPVSPTSGEATCTATYTTTGSRLVTASYSGSTMLPPVGPSAAFTQGVVPRPTAVITSPSGISFRGATIRGTASDVGGPGLLGVILYFHSDTGGPSGAVLATCTSCGPGLTTSTWSFTPPAGSIPGIYSFVAQPFDVAFNPGPASNVIYQVIP